MPIIINQEAFYTVRDLAEILNKSVITARKYCTNKKITPCKKVGREWIIPGKSIIEFLSPDKRKR